MEKEFHTPDTTWDLWKCDSFEEYLKQYLIRGNFHKGVPKDITDAFNTVEHLIAHAYYYYPMYDEALSKVLRTIEMAVRIKCKEHGIATERKNKKGNNTPVPLGQLIDSLTKKEPEKDLNLSLDTFRYLRNSLMHPERNSFMGGMSIAAIIRSVNSLNELFAPTNFFSNRDTLLNSHSAQIEKWKNTPVEVQMDDYYFVAHNIEISDLFPLENRIDVCLYIQPIPELPDYENKEHGYGRSLSWTVSNLEFGTDEIRATNNVDNKTIIISRTKNPEHIQLAKLYLEYLQKFYIKPYGRSDHFVSHEKYKDIAYFRYNHYHLIQGISFTDSNNTN